MNSALILENFPKILRKIVTFAKNIHKSYPNYMKQLTVVILC